MPSGRKPVPFSRKFGTFQDCASLSADGESGQADIKTVQELAGFLI